MARSGSLALPVYSKCGVRSRLLPVRRDVLSRSHIWLPRSKASPEPGGHFLFNVWDRIEENVFADDVTNALAKIFPNDPPRFFARTPHGYHDTALIRSELEEAGFPVWLSRREPNKAAHPHRAFLPLPVSGNSSSQRNRGQRRGKTGSCNRLRRIRDCASTWQRRGCAKIQAHVIVAVV